MTALLLAIICSTSIALILKANDVRGGHPLTLLAGNYFIATILGGLFLLTTPDRTFSIETLLLSMALALGFTFTFFIFAKAVGAAGAALATVSSRMSMVIPVALSIFLYKEIPSPYQYVGFAFTALTLVLFYHSTRATTEEHRRAAAYFYLFALFIGIGLNDFAMKLFQEWRPPTDKPFFLLCVFAFSFVYTVGLMLWRRTKPDMPTLRRGMVLGVPNILSSFFLLSALTSLEAIFVYPAMNIGVILLTTLGAALLWRERLDRWGVLALLTGTLAIVLTGMGA